jgi:hypothetical protein
VTLRLLSYNIRHGGSGREASLAAVIRNTSPDVVVFQEATKPAVIEALARQTGMTQHGIASRRLAGLHEPRAGPRGGMASAAPLAARVSRTDSGRDALAGVRRAPQCRPRRVDRAPADLRASRAAPGSAPGAAGASRARRRLQYACARASSSTSASYRIVCAPSSG